MDRVAIDEEEDTSSARGILASRGVSGGPKDEQLASLIPDDLMDDDFNLSTVSRYTEDLSLIHI